MEALNEMSTPCNCATLQRRYLRQSSEITMRLDGLLHLAQYCPDQNWSSSRPIFTKNIWPGFSNGDNSLTHSFRGVESQIAGSGRIVASLHRNRLDHRVWRESQS